MSATRYNDELIYGTVPKGFRKLVKEYMEENFVSLADAFHYAAAELAKPGTELYEAWWTYDYRKFIPCEYEHYSLDFNAYPLKYSKKDIMERRKKK